MLFITTMRSGLVLLLIIRRVLWSSLEEFLPMASPIYDFNYPIRSLPINYLGLGKISKSLWVSLIDKVQRRLAGWKGRLLSLGGRITMINAVLSAILTYFLSFFSYQGGWKRTLILLRGNSFGWGTWREGFLPRQLEESMQTQGGWWG